MQRGFSLLELSIVLVIIGLLAGGVMTGQSLIRAAELRSVITDFHRYIAAYHTFRDKYMALPGDMKNATAFWGIAGGATGNDATCQNTASISALTCNGNGNGWIDTNWVAYGERFRFWQHLANAGLVEGSYTGRDGAATPGDMTDPNFNVRGVNVPAGKISDSRFGAAHRPLVSGHTDWFDGDAFNILSFYGGTSGPLKPEEAWNIDMKYDDGKPAYGIIVNVKSTGTWGPNCATTGVSATAEYNLSSSTPRCPLYWILK